MAESLKLSLLKAIGNDESMRQLLLECMHRTEAEFCGFYTALERGLAYILLESTELENLVSEIKNKLVTSYRMFANFLQSEEECDCRLFYMKERANIAYLLGRPRIESYFLVPVLFGSKVRGVLFLGSIRKEAFKDHQIAIFRNLASEGSEQATLHYRLAGEKELLDRLLASIPYGTALVSSDGRIVSFNSAFSRVLLLDDEVPGTISELSEVSSFNFRGLWEEFAILQVDLYERELKSSRTDKASLAVSWTRLEDLAQDVSSIIVIRDTSEERAQAQVREEMVAMVAHELRTPLAALKSSLEIAADSCCHSVAASSSPEVATQGENPAIRFISSAIRTVERLSVLVDSLIDSSAIRLDARKLRIDLYDVESFLDEAVSLFVEPMHKKGIKFIKHVSPEIDRLAFDRDRIEQVIQNLLSNSMKHVQAGGSIAITVVPCYRCDFVQIPDLLVNLVGGLHFADLCIRDTGIGIPPETVNQINMSMTSDGRNLGVHRGLGLYVAQRLVRLHGGVLVIEKGVAGGSAVHLYLPANEGTALLMRALQMASLRFEEMVSRGIMPKVCFVEKMDDLPWDRALEDFPGGVAIEPPRTDLEQARTLIWPITPVFAIALSNRGSNDLGDGRGYRIGFASAPADGMSFTKLLSLSIEYSLGKEQEIPVPKGESL